MVPLSFGWRHALFANWSVDRRTIAARVPDALDVEEHEGSAWVSIVALLHVDTAIQQLPVMTGFPRPEVTLQTSVSLDGEPGVYVFSRDIDSLLSVLATRLAHYLPAYYASIQLRQSDGQYRVTSRRRQRGDRPARFSASYEPTGETDTAEPGSLAAFLVEGDRRYTEAPDGSLRYIQVDHDPWPLRDVDVEISENTLFEANGFDHPETKPYCVYSPGVDVLTSRSKRY